MRITDCIQACWRNLLFKLQCIRNGATIGEVEPISITVDPYEQPVPSESIERLQHTTPSTNSEVSIVTARDSEKGISDKVGKGKKGSGVSVAVGISAPLLATPSVSSDSEEDSKIRSSASFSQPGVNLKSDVRRKTRSKTVPVAKLNHTVEDNIRCSGCRKDIGVKRSNVPNICGDSYCDE